MEVKDLRLENLVTWEGTVDTVENLTSDWDGLEDYINSGHIEPIKLTEEWLERFGFELSCDMYEIDNSDFLFSIELDKDFFLYTDHYGGGKYYKEIRHVHTLQNLYFALTGTELTLKEDYGDN